MDLTSMYKRNDTMRAIGNEEIITADSELGQMICDVVEAMDLPKTTENYLLAVNSARLGMIYANTRK